MVRYSSMRLLNVINQLKKHMKNLTTVITILSQLAMGEDWWRKSAEEVD